MPLNPFQLGEEVVEQFQRYLLTYFPIADRRLEEQVRAALWLYSTNICLVGQASRLSVLRRGAVES